MFPWLIKFANQQIKNAIAKYYYAPSQIIVPLEFLAALPGSGDRKIKISKQLQIVKNLQRYNLGYIEDSADDIAFNREIGIKKQETKGHDKDCRSCLNYDRADLIDRICSAFRRNGYTYYQQYIYLMQNYGERSLHQIPDSHLRRILLNVVNGNVDLPLLDFSSLYNKH